MPIDRYDKLRQTSVDMPQGAIERLKGDIGRINDRVARVLDHYTNNELRPGNDYVLLEGVALTAGTEQRLEHGLARAVRGYRIVRKSAPATIFDAMSTSSADLTKYLPLVTDVNCTISLEVF